MHEHIINKYTYTSWSKQINIKQIKYRMRYFLFRFRRWFVIFFFLFFTEEFFFLGKMFVVVVDCLVDISEKMKRLVRLGKPINLGDDPIDKERLQFSHI